MAKADMKMPGVWKTTADRGISGKGWVANLPGDGAVMRTAFYLMLAAIVIGLIYDYRHLSQRQAEQEMFTPSRSQPVLPSYDPGSDDGATDRTTPAVTADPDDLRSALQVTLTSGGVLKVTGTIDPGSAERFSKEVARVGEYVERVELNSPGGSVRDALEISRLIREGDLDTFVSGGALCASSCPLIFAAGENRIAEKAAAIGVHQVFSGTRRGPRDTDLEISGTQRLTAQITRHLEAMGVDPDLWLHALDTPPDQLYYFTVDELKDYRLATEITDPVT